MTHNLLHTPNPVRLPPLGGPFSHLESVLSFINCVLLAAFLLAVSTRARILS